MIPGRAQVDAPSNPGSPQMMRVPLQQVRRLILRDGVIILLLLLSAVVLYGITAFLFGSFTQRRAELGKQFGELGEKLLARGDSEQAIQDLRISLRYAPDDPYSQLLLAEALAQSNHREEARSYFLSLLDVQPADGFINLQLARLSRQRNEAQKAIEYYRAAAVGNWNNGPPDARFRVQFELSNFLIVQHRIPAARAELLIAAADAPATTDALSELGDSFLDANDQTDAVNQYEKAANLNPQDLPVLMKAGRILFLSGRYAEAYGALSRASSANSAAMRDDAESAELQSLTEKARRIQELTIGQNLPTREREQHLRRDLSIARVRFTACRAKQADGSAMTSAMQRLDAEWHIAEQSTRGRGGLDGDIYETNMTKLVFDTEEVTEALCGPPVGDDALLFVLANVSKTGH